MFGRTKTEKYVSDIAISQNQSKFLVNQVVSQLSKFYNGVDMRKMILNAFTGSGKTTVTIKELVPKFVQNFPDKRVIGFISPKAEVVGSSFTLAKKALDGKTINGNLVKVYNYEDINLSKKQAARYNTKSEFGGDVVFVFMTAQYFYYNYDELTTSGAFDLMIVDEAHLMFGTIDKQDTKQDKGVHMETFRARTLEKLYEMPECAVLYLTATPTNSQKMLTDLGVENNVYLKPMPRDVLTTPFFEMVSYFDFEDTLFKGILNFKKQCDSIAKVMSAINAGTWKQSDKIVPTYPALLIRSSRRGSVNGIVLDEYMDEIRKKCEEFGFKLFISTSDNKELDGKKVVSLDEGVRLASQISDTPVVLVVIESGTAGLDYVKLNNVIIARRPSSPIANNWSQTAGRAARMKFGFRNHYEAVEAIQKLNVSDEQKMLLAEYYVLHSTSTVHVPVDSKVLNVDVKEFIETDTFRAFEGRDYVLNGVFGEGNVPVLRTKTYLEENSYKRFQKTYCEVCNDSGDGETYCFHSAWKSFQNLTGVNLSYEEMKMLWVKALQTHHMDGNHFNNAPDNRKTICPSVHAVVTMHNEDYNNRYTEVREMLGQIAKKKRGNPNIVNLCFG